MYFSCVNEIKVLRGGGEGGFNDTSCAVEPLTVVSTNATRPTNSTLIGEIPAMPVYRLKSLCQNA